MNVLEYLERSAALWEDKKAVSDETSFYTFRELMDQAKCIGSCLKGTGVGENEPVGVFVDRSKETISMFLGVLYSGNFYVPLDPSLPLHKIELILANAGISFVVGKEEYREIAGKLEVHSFISASDYDKIDPAWPCITEIPPVGEDAPLYMIYTSGSTGVPKGVLKSHKAECSYIEAFCQAFDHSEQDVIGNQTPFSFDASGKDIYLMLKTGAALEILPSEYFTLPLRLIRYMNERKVTIISWVPSALCVITQLNTFQELLPEYLRRVLFVGEAFPMKQFLKWQKALPEIEFVNLYGASEICGISCYYQVKGDVSSLSVLPIGKPLMNCEVFLVDQGKRITESKQVGEIHIVSDALALEYYKDPEKTDKAFFYLDGKRTFRSGDLAWYDEDGNLNFAARNDSQIKHMGYRIELGEIEAIAGTLSCIDRCCCLYQQEKKKIYLFVQLSSGSTEDKKSVKMQLQQILTDYMMPQKIVILEKMPWNANGKIDRVYLKTLMK